MTRTLTRHQLRRHYERYVARQDRQGWYEDAALEYLMEAGEFGDATAVVEAGCGTGRFAEWLLAGSLHGNASYCGIDISTGMLARADGRLGGYGSRVRLVQGDVATGLPLRRNCCDRFIATYLIDLLAGRESRTLIAEAYRILEPGGLICLASLSRSPAGAMSMLVTKSWSVVRALAPRRVGGCRPVRLEPLLAPFQWKILCRHTVAPRGVASEIIVARKTGAEIP